LGEIFFQVWQNRVPRWDFEIALIFALCFVVVFTLAIIFGARRLKLAGIMLLFTYIYNVLVTTLLMREPVQEARYTFEILFVKQIFTDHNLFALAETILNFLLLFPVGLIMPLLFKNLGALKTCIFGAAFSFAIEYTQLVTHLGEFQTDDLLMNTLGCCFGALITAILTAIWRWLGEEDEKD
jgi:glycopeptide antibiotics resistance protein